MESTTRTKQRPAGALSACRRCRRRKQKCDQNNPRCSNCESAAVPCLDYNVGKQLDLPRDYVSTLEEQITQLTLEARGLRARLQTDLIEEENTIEQDFSEPPEDEPNSTPAEASTLSDGSPALINLVKSVEEVVLEPLRQPRFLGQSSGIFFAKLVMAAIHDNRPSASMIAGQHSDASNSVATAAQTSLPPRHVANHLEEVYFQYRTPHMPILNRSQVRDAINYAYNPAEENEGLDSQRAKGTFTAYMVFAIALADVPHALAPTSRPSESEGCFRSALSWLEWSLTYSKADIETLRITLLLAQFVALAPSRGSLWHLTGFAMRLCIDIGLHWELDSQRCKMSADVLDDRRRLWYSTYYFDRLLCITLGRPFGVLEQSTQVQLPKPWILSRQSTRLQSNDFDVQTQRAHNHMFTLARLESEIRHVQHSESWSLGLAYPRPDRAAWYQDIRPRLQEWFDTIPGLDSVHKSSIFACKAFWEVSYYNIILTLHRPNSTPSFQRAEEVLISFEASCKVISGLKELQREGKIEILWKSAYQLFMAGLGVIYTVWHSKDVRDQTPVRKCISTLQSCASTLTAMSETFRGASGCRDTFDTLSAITIDFLVSPNTEEEQQTRAEFQNHIRDLRYPLGIDDTGTAVSAQGFDDDLSAILSTNAFDLGDLLNNAAQWPDLESIDMSVFESDTGLNFGL